VLVPVLVTEASVPVFPSTALPSLVQSLSGSPGVPPVSEASKRYIFEVIKDPVLSLSTQNAHLAFAVLNVPVSRVPPSVHEPSYLT